MPPFHKVIMVELNGGLKRLRNNNPDIGDYTIYIGIIIGLLRPIKNSFIPEKEVKLLREKLANFHPQIVREVKKYDKTNAAVMAVDEACKEALKSLAARNLK